MFTLFRRRDERGVTAIEYGILASLIAIVTIAGVTASGAALSSQFATLGNHLGTLQGPKPPKELRCDADGNYVGGYSWVRRDFYIADPDGVAWSDDETYFIKYVGQSTSQWYVLDAGSEVAIDDPGSPAPVFDSAEWQAHPLTVLQRDAGGDPAMLAVLQDGYPDPLDDGNPTVSGPLDDTGCRAENVEAWKAANCDAGQYTGPTKHWYWYGTVTYEHGQLISNGSGDPAQWFGDDNGSGGTYAENNKGNRLSGEWWGNENPDGKRYANSPAQPGDTVHLVAPAPGCNTF